MRMSTVFIILIMSVTSHAATIHIPADYTTFQTAIDSASDGDAILVADGTYTGSGNINIEVTEKSLWIISENGPGACLIDPNYEGRAFHLTTLSGSLYLEGFTIQNGKALPAVGGGAILQRSGSLTVSNCVFQKNSGMSSDGGAIYIDGGQLTVKECLFEDNHASSGGAIQIFPWHGVTVNNCRFYNNSCDENGWGWGGAISCHSASPMITGCVFQGNQSTTGGAIDSSKGDPVVTDCIFLNNEALSDGGAINCYYESAPEFHNCLIVGNTAGRGGGGVRLGYCSPIFGNCTFSGNVALEENAGAVKSHDTELIMQNCILWGNSPVEIVHEGGYPTPKISFSDVQGGRMGEGNIDSDPLFVEGPSGSYYLSQFSGGQKLNSPCVNSGAGHSEFFCFEILMGQTCYDLLTTCSQDEADFDPVDMGYHSHLESEPSAMLRMPSHTYSEGDECECTVTVHNPAQTDLVGYPLFVILQLVDTFYFAPAFSEEPDHYLELYPAFPSGETVVSVIAKFKWPADIEPASEIVWYTALTDPEITKLCSAVDQWEFQWK